MNSKHAFLVLSVFTLVSIAYGEREVFAPTKLAPVAEAGTIKFDNGTPAAPSMTFKSDDNTGIYRAGADTIGFTTNGNIRAAIDGYNMCIGNNVAASAPQNGTLSATSGSGTNIAGASMTIRGGNSTGNAAGGYVAFQTAAAGASGSTANTLTERMRIQPDGIVNIGSGVSLANATPFAGKEVVIAGGNANGEALSFYANASFVGNTGRIAGIPTAFGSNSASALTFSTNSGSQLNERMRITSAGRVGIGTTNPAAALHVVQSSLVQQFRVQDVETDATQKVGVSAVGHYTNAEEPLAVIFGRSQSTSNDVSIGGNSGSFNSATQITFHTAANNTTLTGTERMRIDSSGNVGIGTTTNLSTLTINGPIAPKGPTDVNAATYTVQTTDSSLRFTTTNCTVTLPAAASFPGRILWLNTVTANSVTSNASNVIPLGSNTAGTAIFAATAGKFAMIQSNGTNWVTMMSN